MLKQIGRNFIKVPGSGEDEEVRQPPESCFDFTKDHDSDNSLTAGLSNTGNVVGDWRSALNNSLTKQTNICPFYLDLEADNVTHSESKSAGNGHRNPELGGVEEGEVGEGTELSSDNHKGNEDNTGVDVVVVSKLPDIVVNLVIPYLTVYI